MPLATPEKARESGVPGGWPVDSTLGMATMWRVPSLTASDGGMVWGQEPAGHPAAAGGPPFLQTAKPAYCSLQ